MKYKELTKPENTPHRVWETPQISTTMKVQKVKGALIVTNSNNEGENYIIAS